MLVVDRGLDQQQIGNLGHEDRTARSNDLVHAIGGLGVGRVSLLDLHRGSNLRVVHVGDGQALDRGAGAHHVDRTPIGDIRNR